MKRLRSGGLAFADQALVSASNCITTVIAVRALGLGGFGHFALLWMGVLFVLGLQQALVSTPMLTIGPKQPEDEARDYYAGALRLELAFLGLAGLATLLLAGPVARASGLVLAPGELAALIACTLARCAQDFVRQKGFAREQRRLVLVTDGCASLLQLLGLALLGLGGTLTPALALAVLAAANAGGVLVWLCARGGLPGGPGSLARVVARHAGMSRWLLAQSLLQWTTSNAFAIAAGLVLGPAAVGAIKAGQTVMGLLHVWLLTLENVAPVRAARLLAREATAELRSFWRRVQLGGGIATLAASAALALLAAPLARLFFGATNPEQELVIRAFALHYVVVFATTVLTIRLRTLERMRPVFIAQALGAGFGALAARPLVEAFGLGGALAGMIAQQLLVALALWIAARRLESGRAAQAAECATGA